MTKLALPLLLLLLSLAPGYAATPPKPCPAFKPSKDKAKWTWKDRHGCRRTRADLERILHSHELWLEKYPDYLEDRAALSGHGALRDSLRADLSSAFLEDVDLTDWNLNSADLSGADLRRAHLNSADLNHADLADAQLYGLSAILSD